MNQPKILKRIKHVTPFQKRSNSSFGCLCVTFSDESEGFLKFFLKPEVYDSEEEIHCINSRAGLYEAEVYERVIQPLVDRNICPHFVRLICRRELCTFYNMNRLWWHRTPKRDITIDDDTDEFIREINKCLLPQRDEREVPILDPAPRQLRSKITRKITGKIAGGQINNDIYMTYKFHFFVIEKIKGISLHDFIDHSPKLDLETMLIILFQIVYTCHIMSHIGMAHNDLHFGNIFIETTSNTPICYKLDTFSVLMNVTHFVKIIDFDQSHIKMEPLNNPPRTGVNENTAIDLLKLLKRFYLSSKKREGLQCFSRIIVNLSNLYWQGKESYNESIENIQLTQEQYHTYSHLVEGVEAHEITLTALKYISRLLSRCVQSNVLVNVCSNENCVKYKNFTAQVSGHNVYVGRSTMFQPN